MKLLEYANLFVRRSTALGAARGEEKAFIQLDRGSRSRSFKGVNWGHRRSITRQKDRGGRPPGVREKKEDASHFLQGG